MANKGKYTELLLIFGALFFIIEAVAQQKYPNIDDIYTKRQLDSMLQKYQNDKDTLGLAITYWTYAKNEENANSLNDSPLMNLRKSMECFQAVKDYSSFYDVRGAIGSYFMDRAFIKKFAKEYIESAVNYFRSIKKPKSEIGHLINLANINIHENNFGPVKKMLDRVEILNKEAKSEDFLGRMNSSYSDYYVRLGKYDEAFKHAEISYEIGKRLKIGWLEALSLFIKAKCYENTGKPDLQIEALLESLRIVEKNANLYQLEKEVFEGIQKYYFIKKDFRKANEYSLKTLRTVENIYYSKIESDLRSFSEYNLIEKQRMVVSKIALEKKLTDIELDKLLIRQQMYLGILFFSFLIIILLVVAFYNRRRISNLVAVEASKNNHIETLNALINGQELERVRISQELHDGLGTMLSRTKILMGKGITQDNIIQMIDEACAEIRTISGNLQPNTLANFGLIRALEDFVSKQNSIQPNIIFQHFGEVIDLGMNKNLMIYRIIQELLTNSLKHANAHEILIQIMFSQESVNLTVEDDGVGFEEKEIKTENSGWNNIRSRINYLQGTLNLHSDLNSGTSVTVTIPLQ